LKGPALNMKLKEQYSWLNGHSVDGAYMLKMFSGHLLMEQHGICVIMIQLECVFNVSNVFRVFGVY
jgi:hypothetical protein